MGKGVERGTTSRGNPQFWKGIFGQLLQHYFDFQLKFHSFFEQMINAPLKMNIESAKKIKLP